MMFCPPAIGAMSGGKLGANGSGQKASGAVSAKAQQLAPVMAGGKLPGEPTVWLPTERMAQGLGGGRECGTPFEK